MYQELKDRGLAVLLIDFGENSETVKKAATERGYVAPVLVDESSEVAGRRYGVWGPPTVYLVDREGRLIGRIPGARDWGSVAARRLVEALVDEPPSK